MKFVFKTLLLVLFSFVLVFSQTKQPTKEVRAVWIGTIGTSAGLDWPGSASSGGAAQRNEAIRILDGLKGNNFNTVVLQVRGRGDALYASKIEPWAACLTGTLGRDPGWDPLQFWVEETHNRGMEFHAWWNFSNTVSGTSAPTSAGLPHIAALQPTWVKAVGSSMYMDVGIPEARNYLVNLAMEMVRGYDIDAIHFDFIRYLENTPDSWDQSTYNQHGDGMSRADWRRENINKFVRAIYDSIKAIKPWVKVGSTPIGNYEAGVPGVVSGLWGYSAVYCDSRRWLREGKHDYLAPQIYWNLEGNNPYRNILIDWVKNSSDRHIWGGVASYQADSSSNKRYDPITRDTIIIYTNPTYNVYSNTARIIQATREEKSAGNIYFRLYQNITRNNYESTKSSYVYPVNIPSMPWLDSIPPAAPKNLTIAEIDNKTWRLTWDKSSPGIDGDPALYYNIYRGIWTVIDYENGENLYHITTNDDNSFTVTFNEPPSRNYYFAVTALDRLHTESAPSNVVSITVTSVADLDKPAEFKLEQNYPNPFNPATNIAYHISSRANVRLSVYNILGQEVRELVNEVKDAGDYIVKFDAGNLSTGVYLYRLEVSTGNKTYIDHKKMLLTK